MDLFSWWTLKSIDEGGKRLANHVAEQGESVIVIACVLLLLLVGFLCLMMTLI